MSAASEFDSMALLQKVAKWRNLLTGWQLGTRDKSDPEAQAVRDAREMLIIMRVELSTLTRLLLEAGTFTQQQFVTALGDEAYALDQDYERRFPGVTSTDHGLVFDGARAEEIKGWMGHWKP